MPEDQALPLMLGEMKLRHVLPNAPLSNRANQRSANAIALCQHRSLFARSHYFARLIIGQLHFVGEAAPRPPITAPTRFPVACVVKLRPPTEMCRINAGWIIATVKRAVGFRWPIFSINQQRDLVRFKVNSPNAELPVPLSAKGAPPIPAMAGAGNLDGRPKAGDDVTIDKLYRGNSHCADSLRFGQGWELLAQLTQPAFLSMSPFLSQEEVA